MCDTVEGCVLPGTGTQQDPIHQSRYLLLCFTPQLDSLKGISNHKTLT